MKAFKGFVIVNNNGYHYEGMQYSRKSKYGIEGGKIAKLTIKCKGKVVASYDKAWNIEPSNTEQREAFDIIAFDYN